MQSTSAVHPNFAGFGGHFCQTLALDCLAMFHPRTLLLVYACEEYNNVMLIIHELIRLIIYLYIKQHAQLSYNQ